jgi:TatA/E family protein of Tat protein translocase
MLSIPHLIVIFVVALVVFGPEKLPELARNLGKVMAEFRRHTNDLRSSFEGHLRDLEREADVRRIAGPVPVPSAPPPAAQQTMAPPAIPSPGTVPSNPPNAAAVHAGSSGATTPDEISPAAPRKYPGDDPFLQDLANGEFGPAASAQHQPEPSEPEKIPQRVTDGDVPPA